MQSVASSKSFAKTLIVPHNQSAHLSTQSPFYKHYPKSGSNHHPSYPGPYALSPHNYDSPQTRNTKNQVHFSLSPIQCRPTSNYTSSQSFSVPTSSSRQYHNHQNQNHVTNLSDPLSPHTTESVEIDYPPPSDEFYLSHYQYPQSKQSKQYEYRRRSCPGPV